MYELVSRDIVKYVEVDEATLYCARDHTLLRDMKMLNALLVILIGGLNMQKLTQLKRGNKIKDCVRILFTYTTLARLLKPP